VLYFILANQETIFVILLIINLITDFLDGFIARKFNMETEFGARLDSLADEGTYILAFVGIFMFKAADFEPYKISALSFLSAYVLSILISLIKFKKMPSLHLYSSKVGAIMQGAFFFVLFIFGFYTVFYYVMIIWGIVSFLEQIIILLIGSEMKPNSKGLYWVLNNQ
jgi:CDP-diacylglycerol--glycerol-3-phosphate 3-phosphatidyltransferase